MTPLQLNQSSQVSYLALVWLYARVDVEGRELSLLVVVGWRGVAVVSSRLEIHEVSLALFEEVFKLVSSAYIHDSTALCGTRLAEIHLIARNNIRTYITQSKL